MHRKDSSMSKKSRRRDGVQGGCYEESPDGDAAENVNKESKRRKHDLEVRQGSLWSFEVDYNDHFETPLAAYADVAPVLDIAAKLLGKDRSSLVLYDPYYCQGNMRRHLASLGFTNVINDNRDFYKDVEEGKVPEYDVLITNPPFSGDHKPRLLNYLKSSGNKKPFLLVLPAYTATKSYWREFTASVPGASGFMYIMPRVSYTYDHPEGTGKAVPPFYSAWFVGGFQDMERVRAKFALKLSKTIADPSQRCVLLNCVDSMVRQGFISGAKRANPRARSKKKEGAV